MNSSFCKAHKLFSKTVVECTVTRSRVGLVARLGLWLASERNAAFGPEGPGMAPNSTLFEVPSLGPQLSPKTQLWAFRSLLP